MPRPRKDSLLRRPTRRPIATPLRRAPGGQQQTTSARHSRERRRRHSAPALELSRAHYTAAALGRLQREAGRGAGDGVGGEGLRGPGAGGEEAAGAGVQGAFGGEATGVSLEPPVLGYCYASR